MSNPFSENLKGHPFCHPINFLGMLAVFPSINWCYSMEISKLIIIPIILLLAWDCCRITKICKFFYHHSIWNFQGLNQRFLLWWNFAKMWKKGLGESPLIKYRISFLIAIFRAQQGARCHPCKAWLGSIATYITNHHCDIATYHCHRNPLSLSPAYLR
jgi:hypothetical protein